ncbi:uncharacterized protein LOC142986348 isoform X3 [Anticarsia gemmatalis]|uniref:uncharacterized protein LOC142986348 isoform X3 n=1 Tax=Anticarsia gemmatalis TaxID=129554 RepID=UPI003F765ECA
MLLLYYLLVFMGIGIKVDIDHYRDYIRKEKKVGRAITHIETDTSVIAEWIREALEAAEKDLERRDQLAKATKARAQMAGRGNVRPLKKEEANGEGGSVPSHNAMLTGGVGGGMFPMAAGVIILPDVEVPGFVEMPEEATGEEPCDAEVDETAAEPVAEEIPEQPGANETAAEPEDTAEMVPHVTELYVQMVPTTAEGATIPPEQELVTVEETTDDLPSTSPEAQQATASYVEMDPYGDVQLSGLVGANPAVLYVRTREHDEALMRELEEAEALYVEPQEPPPPRSRHSNGWEHCNDMQPSAAPADDDDEEERHLFGPGWMEDLETNPNNYPDLIRPACSRNSSFNPQLYEGPDIPGCYDTPGDSNGEEPLVPPPSTQEPRERPSSPIPIRGAFREEEDDSDLDHADDAI